MRNVNSDTAVFVTVSLVASACLSEITYGDVSWAHLNQSFFFGVLVGWCVALIFVFSKGTKSK